jgi:hypothetical protein
METTFTLAEISGTTIPAGIFVIPALIVVIAVVAHADFIYAAIRNKLS